MTYAEQLEENANHGNIHATAGCRGSGIVQKPDYTVSASAATMGLLQGGTWGERLHALEDQASASGIAEAIDGRSGIGVGARERPQAPIGLCQPERAGAVGDVAGESVSARVGSAQDEVGSDRTVVH